MYLERIFGKKSKLQGSYSSNLTRFQLNRRKFVFFTRGGSKTFYTQPFGQLCIKYGLIVYKIDFIQFCNKYIVGPSQKTHFRHSENKKLIFRPKKMRTSLGNIVDIPRCTLVYNIRSFGQTMPWMWP